MTFFRTQAEDDMEEMTEESAKKASEEQTEANNTDGGSTIKRKTRAKKDN